MGSNWRDAGEEWSEAAAAPARLVFGVVSQETENGVPQGKDLPDLRLAHCYLHCGVQARPH